MSRATTGKLAELHKKLAEVLLECIEETAKDENGNTIPPSPAMLNVARQFLKDNKIEAIAVKGSALDGLSNALPEFDEESDANNLNYQ